MLEITRKDIHTNGERWTIQRVGEEWHIKVAKETMHLREEMKGKAGRLDQRGSDLDFDLLDYYCLKLPAVWFYPWITYFIRRLAPRMRVPAVLFIPNEPPHKEAGRNWLMAMAQPSWLIVAEGKNEESKRLAWIDKKDMRVDEESSLSAEEVHKLALAVEEYLLYDLRFVYAEAKSSDDLIQDFVASRYHYPDSVVHPESTKQYLDWYINQIGQVMTTIVAIDDAPCRKVVALMINRLAVNIIIIMAVDIPYIRKWYFLGLLDMLASLESLCRQVNERSQRQEAELWECFLAPGFWEAVVFPALQQIPVDAIRSELLSLSEQQLKAIGNLGSEAIDILRDYRNSYHGYYLLKRKSMERLLQHSGEIPDNLPDLAIGLWHYLLMDLIPRLTPEHRLL